MEAYLKKLCFEYQVEEKEVKELLARMERDASGARVDGS